MIDNPLEFRDGIFPLFCQKRKLINDKNIPFFTRFRKILKYLFKTFQSGNNLFIRKKRLKRNDKIRKDSSPLPCLFFFFFKLPHWVFVVAHGLLTRCEGFSCCEAPAPLALGSVVAAPGLCCPTACETLVPQPGRDWTSFPLIGRWIVNHWTTWGVPLL